MRNVNPTTLNSRYALSATPFLARHDTNWVEFFETLQNTPIEPVPAEVENADGKAVMQTLLEQRLQTGYSMSTEKFLRSAQLFLE